MKLYCVTVTGLDDHNDKDEIRDLSQQYPWLEWGILLSESRMGQPRYPSREWISDFFQNIEDNDCVCRLAAHLCGDTMRKFVSGTRRRPDQSDAWMEPFGLTPLKHIVMFDRSQINFNASTEGFGVGTIDDLMDGWYENYSGNIITQHNTTNHWVWSTIQKKERGVLRAHQILHDASGGQGKSPGAWNRPIAGVLNGYAGGIRPSTVVQTLLELEQVVGDGYIWIDMEGGVRDGNDRMNMPAVHHMLKELSMVGVDRNWF